MPANEDDPRPQDQHRGPDAHIPPGQGIPDIDDEDPAE